jgi:hypothetical protein
MFLTQRFRILIAGIICFTFGVLPVLSSHATSQTQPTLISVDDPRPLAAAVIELEKRLGWLVTYEDPSYRYAGDVQDVTSNVRRYPGRGVLIPRGGRLEFTFEARTGVPVQAEQRRVLAELLSQNERHGYPGGFRLEFDGAVAHVVPTRAADEGGRPRAYRSVLDQVISLPEANQSALDALGEIITVLNGSGTPRVQIGTVPTNRLANAKVKSGADRESARVVLLRVLHAASPNLSWQIFCDPGAVYPCALNVHAVSAPKTR